MKTRKYCLRVCMKRAKIELQFEFARAYNNCCVFCVRRVVWDDKNTNYATLNKSHQL